MTLTRTTLGRLVAYSDSPETDVTEAFDAGSFQTTPSNVLSVVSGALRCAVTVDAAANRSSQSVIWAAGGDALEDVLVQAVMKSHSSPNSGLGVVARSDSFGQAPNRASSRVEGVSLVTLLTNATGGASDSDTVAPQTLDGYRLSLACVGSAVDAYHFPTATAQATTTTQGDGYAGLYFSAGAGTPSVEWRAFYVCGRYLTVTNLPTGFVAQVLDAADAVLASAAESSGTATVDLLTVAFPAARKVRVVDGSANVIYTVEPDEAVWGGDVWAYPTIAAAFTVDVDLTPALLPAEPVPLAYRFRIRTQSTQANPNGTADALVITSLLGGENPYMAAPPEGDGQELDLLTGALRTGAYRVRVIDAEVVSDGEGWGFDWDFDWGGDIDGTQRVVTRVLEDSEYRQQLLSRRAYVERSRDGGVTWEELLAGYITNITLGSAISYDFTIGDTRRVETTRRIFTWNDTPGPSGISERDVFPSRGCLAGGPIIGGFGPLNDTGGDIWQVTGTIADNVISNKTQLALSALEAFLPPAYGRTRDRTQIYNQYLRVLQPYAQSYTQQNLLTTPFLNPFTLDWVTYPNIAVVVEQNGDSWTGTLWRFYTGPTLYVLFDNDALLTPLPTSGQVRVRLVVREVSETAPLYVDDHPVNIVTDLYDTVGIQYDAASAAAMIQRLGPDLRYALRITDPPILADFLTQSVFGPFGFAVRNNPAGNLEFVATRQLPSDAPSVTIPTDSLRSQDPPIFDLDEGTIVSSFKITYRVLSVATQPLTSNPPPPPDGIVEATIPVVVENSDQAVFSTREVAYDFPGMVHLAGSWEPYMGALISSIVRLGFDRYGRGAPAMEVYLIDGQPGSEAYVGDEVYLDVASYPNRGYRIGESTVGPRIAQVVRRTETPDGPALKLIDSGLGAQPVSPVPVLTVAGSTGAPRTVARFTVTNAAAINATNVLTLAVEFAVGGAEPSGNGSMFARYAPGTIPTAAVALPSVAAGSTVWVRARTEQVERRPSPWTGWASVALASFDPPDSITLADETAESIGVSWVPADSLYWTELFVAPGTTAPADWAPYRVNTFLPGSTGTVIRGLSSATDYRIGVAHRDPATGERTAVISDTTATTANVDTAPPPLAMAVIQLEQDAAAPQGIAIALWPADGSFDFEIERANDVSGAPGPYQNIARVAGTTQIYRDNLPNDGLPRWYRIRHALPGFDPSPYTGGQDGIPAALPAIINLPQLTPVIRTYVIDNGADVDIYWSGSGTFEVDIDGGGYGTPGASPINVVKTPVIQTYQFRAELNGLFAYSLVVVPTDGSAVPSLVSAAAAEDTPIACGVPWTIDVSWTTADPNDTAYRVRVRNFDTTAVVADYLTTDSSSFLDNTAETGNPSDFGVFHTRRYIVEIVRDVDDVVVDSLVTNMLSVETGFPC